MTHYKFPSIGHLRHVKKDVMYSIKNGYDVPTKFDFEGTVKLDGTNGGIVHFPNDKISIQSRTRIITPEDDNYDFASWVEDRKQVFKEYFKSIRKQFEINPNFTVAIFGEYVGQGIQGKTAIAKLPKSFFIFNLCQINEEDIKIWLDLNKLEYNLESKDIYNIHDFKKYYISIDFLNLEDTIKVLEDYVKEVEEQCPVAKHFNQNGCGEGIVFKCKNKEFDSSRYWFKVKGEKHKVTKTKTKIEINPEKLKSINEFINSTVTENRLNQGIEYLKENNFEISEKSTGHFLKWIVQDILKEEFDTMETSNLKKKDITKPISNKARKWFFNLLDRS